MCILVMFIAKRNLAENVMLKSRIFGAGCFFRCSFVNARQLSCAVSKQMCRPYLSLKYQCTGSHIREAHRDRATVVQVVILQINVIKLYTQALFWSLGAVRFSRMLKWRNRNRIKRDIEHVIVVFCGGRLPLLIQKLIFTLLTRRAHPTAPVLWPLRPVSYFIPLSSSLPSPCFAVRAHWSQNPGFDFSGADFNGQVPDARSFMGGVKYT